MKKLFFIWVLILVSLSGQSQDILCIPYFESTGLKKDFQISVSKLLKGYIEESNKYKVILPPKNDSITLTSDMLPEVKAWAQKQQAQYYLLGSLTRLGEVVIINVTLYQLSDDKKLWSDKLKASSPDDLDPILQRIGATIGSTEKGSNNPSIYDVTKYESKELKKIEHNKYFGGAIGGLLPFTKISSKTATSLAAVWSYDARNIILDVRAHYCFSSDLDFYGLAFDLWAPLNNKNNSPFFGGGLGVAATRANVAIVNATYGTYTTYDSNGGLTLAVGGGYLLNRTSSAQVRISANFLTSLYQVNNYTTLGGELKLAFLFK